ncbi:MAG: hypothetical protein IPP69_16735 [Flavobacteriales bacterium]|nr:hypothetical protein [Flavobacteriales bacterium]
MEVLEMDWNWLYSSLAQSAAAIVGIISAFVITKVVSNQGEYAKRLQLIKQLIIDANSLKGEINGRYFRWSNARIRERELKIIQSNLLNSPELPESAEEIYLKASFSTFDDAKKIIEKIQTLINSELSRREDDRKQAFQNFKASSNHPAYFERISPSIVSSSNIDSMQDKLNDEYEIIDAVIIKIERHTEYIKAQLSEASSNPESSPMISRMVYILGLMYIFGVLIPLCILPLPINQPAFWDINEIISEAYSIKGAILSIVSILFFAILGTFSSINIGLKYPANLMSDAESLCHLKNYSKYLVNRENSLSLLKNLESTIGKITPNFDDEDDDLLE